uniref:Uncharacterized protein n=1 Tax=Trichuris muris TaxID=70415 RepID=A0A5S6QY98_TRIMR
MDMTIDMESTLHAVECVALQQQIHRLTASTSARQKTTLKKKLENLYCKHTWEFPRSIRKNNNRTCSSSLLGKVVVNLSSTALDDTQKSILSNGLNIVPTPKFPPILDIIASTEKSLSNADQRTADTIKSCISTILLPRHNIKFNITLIERRTLRDLKKNNTILITKADKGNVVVILDRKTNDVTLSYIRRYIYFTSNSKCPELYGLPKIHKPGTPLRPVTDGYSSAMAQMMFFPVESSTPVLVDQNPLLQNYTAASSLHIS